MACIPIHSPGSSNLRLEVAIEIVQMINLEENL